MATTYLNHLRLFSTAVRIYLVTAALRGFAWDGIRAVLFNLYLLRLGYGPEFVGLAGAAGSLAFSLSCVFAGALGSKWESRRLLVAGLALMAGGIGLLPLAIFVPAAWQAGWLLGGYVLTEFGLAMYFVNGLPFLMTATGPEERHHAFSVQIALVPLAAFAGSLVGGALPHVTATVLGLPPDGAAAYGFSLWLAALILIPGVLALLHVREGRAGRVEVRAAQAPAASAPVTRAVRPPYELIIVLMLVTALRFGGWGAVSTFYNVYLDDGLGMPTALIGAVVAAGQLAAVPAALAAPLLVARWGNRWTIAMGSFAIAVSLLPLALIPHWTAASLGYVGAYSLFYLTTGPIRVFSQEIVSPAWRAAMSGAIGMGPGLSMAAVSLVGGRAIVALGYSSLFLAGAALVASGAWLFWVYFRVPRGELARQPLGGE